MSIFVFVVICLCVCISMVIMSVTVPVCTYLTHALSLKELNVQWLINNLCIRQHKILDQLLKNLLFLCLCVIYRGKYLWYCNGKVVEIKRLRGKLLYTLTKHLFSIHRGLFLEFVSISAKVPMILVLVGDIRWCMCVFWQLPVIANTEVFRKLGCLTSYVQRSHMGQLLCPVPVSEPLAPMTPRIFNLKG